MACFLPTNEALIELARLTGREPNDPALTQLFDALVLRGHLTPWLPDWWELIQWKKAKKIVARWERS
jgi:TorA maturation chaperone TorD